MKKKLKIFAICLFLLVLTSCGIRRNTKETGIVPISAEEFLKSIEEEKNILVFMYSEKSELYDGKQQELKNLSDKLNTNIYVMDPYHINVDKEMDITVRLMMSLEEDIYYVIQEGKIVYSDKYSNYTDTYLALEKYEFNDEIELKKAEETKEDIEEAKKQYDEGNIYEANQHLSKVWSSKEARDFYYNHKEFFILHYWERYQYKKNDSENFNYIGINTFTANSKFDKIVVEGKNGSFEKPNFYSIGEEYYYRVKNKTILVGKTEDKLEEKYTIKYIDKQQLVLLDIKTSEEIYYVRRD